MALTPTDPTKAQIWIRGTAPDQIIDLYVPRGAKGDPGGFVEGTELGTNHLNTIVTPGIYKQTTSANVSSVNGYPFSGIVASLMVTRARTQDIIQTLRPGNGVRAGASIYERASGDTGTTWSAWRVYGSQRTDQTAGRTIYTWDEINNREQLIYGDTGERDITSMLNGTAAAFKIRRVGSMVTIWGVGVQPSANATANFLNANLPGGFRNPNTMAITAYTGLVPKASWLSANGSGLAIDGTSNLAATQYNFMVSFPTIDAWPTTLPGASVVSPPSG